MQFMQITVFFVRKTVIKSFLVPLNFLGSVDLPKQTLSIALSLHLFPKNSSDADFPTNLFAGFI